MAPFVIQYDNQYYSALLKSLKAVIDLLVEFQIEKSAIHDAEIFRDRLMNILRKYFKGQIYSSQSMMISIIREFIKAGEPFVSGVEECSIIPRTDTTIQWFKARRDAPEDGFSSEEMKHVPFDQREKVSTDRFSMPGLPCFYLGNTTYDCWLEMGKPAADRFYVSPVRLKKDFKVFCLASSIFDIIGIVREGKNKGDFRLLIEPKDLKLYVHRLMLMIASSYRVKQGGRNFKSEYVIPQMIMLACNALKLDGVVSYTVKASSEVFSRVCGINLALFAKYPNNRFNAKLKHSNIMDDVELSEAFCMAMFDHLSPAEKRVAYNTMEAGDSESIKNIGTFYYQFDYRQTDFYDFDNYLFAKSKQKARLKH